MELIGLHHVTAISASIRENLRFYTRVLGLRLVKRSVNQDDVSAYHLFYADAVGSPGTDLTFFDWNMPRERRGTHSIIRTYLRVAGVDALDWWELRLREHDVATEPIVERDGRLVLHFEDGEGQRLGLIDDNLEGGSPTPWAQSPVPAERQIRGLGPIVLSVPDVRPTRQMLTQVMGLREAREYSLPDRQVVRVFVMGHGGPDAEVHLIEQPGLQPARQGAGAVHHLAFRTPNEAEYHEWTARLQALRVPNSGEIDRYYFRSLYFREPNGILFEIATDGPGFAVDEDPATLGQHVALPPFLEPHRNAILANLKPID
ncbi:MAG TPA: ring-cleaving dioxygenase [Longimicrobiales bacterium]|nr:ring-cleaving dioxygenase [Longimicrobiales bacterium]